MRVALSLGEGWKQPYFFCLRQEKAYFCRILISMEEFRLLAPLKRDFLL